MPKYYSNCKLQGHDEQGCYNLHLKLYEKKAVSKQTLYQANGKKDATGPGEKEEKGKISDKDSFQVQKKKPENSGQGKTIGAKETGMEP